MLSDCLPRNGKQPEDCIRILCVDDEPYILTTLQRFFRKDNFELLFASSAAAALALLRDYGPVHIVLSDYRMPGLTGVELLQQIHQLWPQTVGILLSGYADLAVVTSAINEDFIYRNLAKPWCRQELRQAINDALAKNQDASNAGDELMAGESQLQD